MQNMQWRDDSEEPGSIDWGWLGNAPFHCSGISLCVVLGAGGYLIFDRHLFADMGDVGPRLLVQKLQKV
jgi:hypothetical protein